MFEQSLIDIHIKKGRSVLGLVLSSVLQGVVLGGLILFPLLNYYELPAAELMTFLVAPPPPPPPPPPPEMAPQKIAPEKFDPLAAPKEIPDEVAIIEEAIPAPAQTIAGVVGGVIGGTPGGQIGGVIGGIISNAPMIAPPPPPKKKAPPTPKRIRVGGAVQRANLIRQLKPVYPALARQARIQGTVRLTAIIAKNGSIEKLEVLSGHPLLIPSALQAVRQWRYKPTLLNGQPVEVVTQVDVIFSLSG